MKYYNVYYRQAYNVSAPYGLNIIAAHNIQEAKRIASVDLPQNTTVVKVRYRDSVMGSIQHADSILKKLERVADSLQYAIDDDEQYKQAVGLLVAFEFGERAFNGAFKRELYQLIVAVNERIFPEYNVIIEYARGL